MVNKRFEDLHVWRKSAQLCENVFLYFNSKKCYQFKDHISRFLIYAKSSCGEFRSQTIIGIKINYIDTDTGKKWREESIQISSMLTGLIKTRKSFLLRDLNKQN